MMQVLHQGSQVSACAIVKGTQRNLFVVPKAKSFEDDDLKTLEQEADADPSMKGQLMKKLHVSPWQTSQCHGLACMLIDYLCYSSDIHVLAAHTDLL